MRFIESFCLPCLLLFPGSTLAYASNSSIPMISNSVVQQLGCSEVDSNQVIHHGCNLLTAIDLTTPFHTPNRWIFAMIQGPPVMGEWLRGQLGPGYLNFCFVEDGKGDCHYSHEVGIGNEMQFDQNIFGDASVVYLKSGNCDPILVEQGIDGAGIGEQPVDHFVWAYSPKIKQFKLILDQEFDGLESERFISNGLLAGDLIETVDNPTSRWPWPWGVQVFKFVPPDRFVKVLYFVGKAAQAGDTPAPDAVIDIDMPEILRRLHESQ